MNIKKLPRNPMRPEKEPGVETELWQPSWKCFCCHDTGIIHPHLATLAIDEYDYNRDKLPRCVNPGCKAGSEWDTEVLADSIDYRIGAATCQQLDAISREDWRQTARTQQINIQALAQEMSLRKRDRTAIEEMEAQQRHWEASNADPSQLKAMALESLGNEYIGSNPL